MNSDTLSIIKNTVITSRINELDFNNIPFGRVFSDHMLIMDYEDGKWQNPIIKGYENLNLSPAVSAIHYGQSIFEGLKAYKNEQGEVLVFRVEDNIRRMALSAERMCMPAVPKYIFKEGLFELLKTDSAWVPSSIDSSLYIRPFMFATDEYIGIRPSDKYKFLIFTCPVSKYYSEPLRVKIETHYTRAASGGVGAAKCAGNYAASLYPAKKAKEKGYHQLIWTDAKEHKYIEESGTMNVFFMVNNVLITPKLRDTILSGITRDSVIKIANKWGIKVEERSISVEEIQNAAKEGTLTDAFGAGTAATIAQIETIGFDDFDYELPPIKERDFSNKAFNYFNQLKRGIVEDEFGWIEKVS